MKCPHCRVVIHDSQTTKLIASDRDGAWVTLSQICPACGRLIIVLACGPAIASDRGRGPEFGGISYAEKQMLAYPRGIQREPCPAEVPKHIAEDYTEACSVLADSPKSAAALGRRCLQALLREKAGVKHSDLSNEIQEVLDGGTLPTDLAQSIDAIRNVGNFAAHPIKSQHSGEIVPVEPNEAEWTLEVLEDLFDFYCVRPALRKSKRDALNSKLTAAGKPPMK